MNPVPHCELLRLRLRVWTHRCPWQRGRRQRPYRSAVRDLETRIAAQRASTSPHRSDKKELLRTWPGPAGLRHHLPRAGEQVHDTDAVYVGTPAVPGYLITRAVPILGGRQLISGATSCGLVGERARRASAWCPRSWTCGDGSDTPVSGEGRGGCGLGSRKGDQTVPGRRQRLDLAPSRVNGASFRARFSGRVRVRQDRRRCRYRRNRGARRWAVRRRIRRVVKALQGWDDKRRAWTVLAVLPGRVR